MKGRKKANSESDLRDACLEAKEVGLRWAVANVDKHLLSLLPMLRLTHNVPAWDAARACRAQDMLLSPY